MGLEQSTTWLAQVNKSIAAGTKRFSLVILICLLITTATSMVLIYKRRLLTFKSLEAVHEAQTPATTSVSVTSSTETASPAETAAPVSGIVNIVFAENDIAWIYNYNGELLVTHDAGQSWTRIGESVSKKFDAFTFININQGWAVDHSGQVWKTDDGGYNWYIISENTLQDARQPYMGASQIIFNEGGIGWVVDTFAVWQTRDSGMTWHKNEQLSYHQLKHKVRSMNFLNPHSGWALCDGGLVLKTDDGGEHWQSIVNNLDFNLTTDIETVHFLDERHGWLAVDDAPPSLPERAVLFTQDGGATWQRQEDINSRISIYDIYFLNTKQGWMSGGKYSPNNDSETGVLLETEDGGSTWRSVRMIPKSDPINIIRFTTANEGWLVTDYSIYRTHNGGYTWQPVIDYPEIKQQNLQATGQYRNE